MNSSSLPLNLAVLKGHANSTAGKEARFHNIRSGLAAILFGVVGFGSRRQVFAILGMVLGAVCLGIFLLAWSTASQLAKTL